jgi:hypothetical protein
MLSGVGSRKSGVVHTSSGSGLRSSDFRLENSRYYTKGLGKQPAKSQPIKVEL